jgi:mannose-1-phosphate guanylyltransferase/mannose-6-phosphate isomerase
MAMRVRTLLLAGGAGTRLWPLSTDERPKQFLKLWGGRSLLRAAYERVHPLSGEEIFVATSERYGDLTLSELKTLPSGNLILEPSRRNTAPAILCAALRFSRDGDPVTVVLPADQTVHDEAAFRRSLSEAAEIAASRRAIVLLGVVPDRPEIEYGYVETETGETTSRRVRRFVEKPDRATAERYLESGNFFWNAGVFVFRPSVLIDEAAAVCPELLSACRRYDERWRERNDRLERETYDAIPDISFDYGVMEKAREAYCVLCDAGWNDVGSYRALKEFRGTDEHGNLVVSDRPVVIEGLSDCVVAAGEEGILVIPISLEGNLREIVARRVLK